MDQVEIDGMLQGAKEYDAEKYLAQAAQLLYVKKKIKIEIVDTEWYVSEIKGDLVLKVDYKADDHYAIINILETIFKDYQRQYDETIGIKPGMEMKLKIVLRLAYLLFKNKDK